MARNTKLTQVLQDKICDALKRGHYMRTAAPLAGVSARSAQSWLARGRVEEKRIEMGISSEMGRRNLPGFSARDRTSDVAARWTSPYRRWNLRLLAKPQGGAMVFVPPLLRNVGRGR